MVDEHRWLDRHQQTRMSHETIDTHEAPAVEEVGDWSP